MTKYFKILPFLAAFILIGANLLWAPVCSGKLQLMNGNEVAMKCFYTGKVSIILSVLLVIMGIEDVLHNKISYLFFIGTGIILFLVPGNSIGFGVCKKEMMVCLSTALWIKGVGIASVLYGISAIFIKDKNQIPS